jgi:hypothetical protein
LLLTVNEPNGRNDMTRITASAVAIAAVLALPATGNASESFGSLLKHSPANGSDQCVENVTGPCTLVGWINPNDAGDPVTSPAPADGVIVKFRIRSSAAESVTFRLATIDKQGDVALAQGAGVGPTVTLAGTEEIEEFPAGVRVHKGDHVALDAPSSHMVYNQGGDEFTYLYAPPLVDGQGPRGASADPTGELLVQAVMESDADRDGLGDETQDANVDRAPSIKRLRVVGGSARLRLSEAATLRIRIDRAKNGHYRNVRTLKRTGRAGRNTLSLGRRLAAGRYRVTVVAVDADGNRSAAKRLSFRRSAD